MADSVKVDYKMRGGKEMKSYVFKVKDNRRFNILNMLDEAVDLIQKHLKLSNILVHCKFGVSRSSSFVIAYLIKCHQMRYNILLKVRFEEAFEFVKSKRWAIHPNEGFVNQLEFYEDKVWNCE